MIPQHRSTEADPYERGIAFGRAQRQAVENTVRSYERLFDALHGLAPADLDVVGEHVARRLDAAAPAALAEVRGIAAGAEVSPARLVAINARTEILAGAGVPECSVIGVSGARSGGDALLAQNWDWHPDAAGSLVVWTITDPSGAWFTTLTEAGILAKIGLNGAGLAVCINILASSEDGAVVSGIPIHVMLRLLLERCRTVGEAEALLRGTDYTASTAITVAVTGATGEAFSTFEVSPRGVSVVRACDGVLTHTNHFLEPIGDAVDTALRDWPDTTARLTDIRRLAGSAGAIGADRVKAALRSHDAGPLAVCCHDPDNPRYAERQQTLASVILHLREGYLELAQGTPCAAPYVEVRPA